VQTFAQRDGDAWIINGHKVWTSLAHFAAWMIILLRTDKTEKHGGLSYFVVPISSALGQGVTVKPLIKMTGETGFNEVLFEDLPVNDGLRLGGLGQGWQVATTTLLHERDAGELVTPRSGGMKNAASHNADTANLIDLARKTQYNGKPAVQDPLLRDRIMQQLIRETGLQENQRRARVPALLEHPARLQLQNKLLRSEIAQETAALALEVAGASASLYLGDENAPAGGQWPLAYMSTYGNTIAAGTSEVQRNILGERVLSLAKSK
jgi:alkylation response protein AidB-like acyl-CoA dehydrogenase